MNRKQVDYYEESRRTPEAINISQENKKMDNGVKYFVKCDRPVSVVLKRTVVGDWPEPTENSRPGTVV